jgi:hypothetical protein
MNENESIRDAESAYDAIEAIEKDQRYDDGIHPRTDAYTLELLIAEGK